MVILLLILGLLWIIAATVQDFKKREIANWINFSLIAFALAVRAFYSVFSSDYNIFLFGLFGLGLFFILAHGFYYARLFAGGDAKLLIAIGPIIPIASSYYSNLLIFFVFIILLLFSGSVYSLIYTVFLVSRNKGKFYKSFRNKFKLYRKYLLILLSIFILFFIVFIGDPLLRLIPVFMAGLSLLYIYIKAVEESCMIEEIKSSKLSVGDWIASPIKLKNRFIESSWEGLTEEEIKLIKKHRKNILIKKGIPFSPAFLIAFILFFLFHYLWNPYWGFW